MGAVPHLVLVAAVALGAVQSAPDSLEHARELYASADYESSLATLERLPPAAAPADATQVQRYRALCLLALGRNADAEGAIEQMVHLDPSYRPDNDEAPRLRAVHAAVRARVLPQVIRSSYADAKAAYDRRDHETAAVGFARTLTLLDSLESADPALVDLRTLASGFADLSRAALEPVPPAAAPEPAVPTPVDTPPSEPPPPAREEPTLPPIIVEQQLPPWNPAAFGSQFQSEFRGAVEVTIDEHGAVTAAAIVEPVHPAYDLQLLEAARRWRYEPARRGGQPIVSVKRVDIVLRPR